MTAELEVAYLGVQVADPTAFGTFLRDVVGLVPGETTADGATTWRNDDRVHRIIVEEGPANDAVFVGLEAGTPDAFTRAVDRARAAGASVTEGTAAEARRPPRRGARPRRHAVGRPVRARARAGRGRDPFDSPLVPGGFVTKDQGFGHVVFVRVGPRRRRPLRPGGARVHAVGLAGDGPRRDAADRALLPLQPASPLPRARVRSRSSCPRSSTT